MTEAVATRRSRILTALGRLAVRHPRKILVAWLVMLLVSGALASRLSQRVDNGGYTPPGSQTDRADQLGKRYFAGLRAPEGYIAVISTRGAQGLLLRDALVARRAVIGTRGVTGVGTPVLSPDRHAALIPMTIGGDLGKVQTYVPGINSALAKAPLGAARAYAVGEGPTTYRMGVVTKKSLTVASLVSFPASTIALLIAFLSISAAILPLGLAAVTVGVTFGLLYLLSYVIKLSVFVEDIVLVLGLGLSIDFSLFMVTRVREALARGAGSADEAVIEAVQTTGRAITISAVTIAAALAGLYVVGVGIFDSLATGAIGATMLALVAALTLVPAMLAVLGDRLERFPIRVAATAARSGRLWHRLADLVIRRPIPVILGTVAVMVVMSIPLIGLRLTYPTIGALPHSDPIVKANRLVTRHFGPGGGTPAVVVARTSPAALVSALGHQPGVVYVDRPQVGTGGWVRTAATLAYAPDSSAATRTVNHMRASLPRTLGPETVVAGTSALGIDLVNRINSRTAAVVITVLLADILLLALIFRAPVIALKASLTTLLSATAALGVMNFIFHGVQGITYFVPLFLFTIVFGLSTDYEVFLLSRIREQYRAGDSNAESVRNAVIRSARSITLAGITMSIVFFAFAAAPIRPLRELGVAQGLAILLDVTLVRALLVPATVVLLGDWNWWRPRLRSRRASVAGPSASAG